jgi:potassium voltage-gated channel Eag-related subfamily H protein 8
MFQNLLHSTALPEYKTAAIKKSRLVLSHYGIFKTCWDWLILIATFYVAIVVPYSAAFRYRNEMPDRYKTIITDVGVEIVFIVGKRKIKFL